MEAKDKNGTVIRVGDKLISNEGRKGPYWIPFEVPEGLSFNEATGVASTVTGWFAPAECEIVQRDGVPFDSAAFAKAATERAADGAAKRWTYADGQSVKVGDWYEHDVEG